MNRSLDLACGNWKVILAHMIIGFIFGAQLAHIAKEKYRKKHNKIEEGRFSCITFWMINHSLHQGIYS